MSAAQYRIVNSDSGPRVERHAPLLDRALAFLGTPRAMPSHWTREERDERRLLQGEIAAFEVAEVDEPELLSWALHWLERPCMQLNDQLRPATWFAPEEIDDDAREKNDELDVLIGEIRKVLA